MRKKSIVFYVCSNGFGHLKRTLLVIRELRRLNPEIGITVFCPATHKRLINQEANFSSLGEIKYNTTISDYEINWLLPETITIERYSRWLLELSRHEYVERNSLVVSDNLVGPLSIFSRAILIGSFLWKDIVRYNNVDVKHLVDYENGLISNLTPTMLGIEQMVMGDIRQKTEFIPLPWFCSKYLNRRSVAKGKSILITGGGTGVMNSLLAETCRKIINIDSSIEIFVDSKIYEQTKQQSESKIKRFSFSDNAFSKLSAVVCRPGMGVLTDCVRYNVPPIAIDINDNVELSHNAAKIKELGIGYSIQAINKNICQISEQIVEFIASSSKRGECLHHLENQPCQGAKLAANFLLRKMQDE